MLDRDQVRKVANLARLQITPEEEEQLTAQLASILAYVEQLGSLDTDTVEPTARAIETRNVTRPDRLEPFADREDMLALAPEPDGDFFQVPRILNTEAD